MHQKLISRYTKIYLALLPTFELVFEKSLLKNLGFIKKQEVTHIRNLYKFLLKLNYEKIIFNLYPNFKYCSIRS